MTEPKIRFKRDDGSSFPDWEEKTFDELAKYKKGPFGSALKKEIFVPEDSDTVKVYEQQNAIGKDWTLKRYFITAEYYKKMQSFEVHAGDIIVSCAGTIGEIYILPENAQNGVINQALMRVRENKSVVNQVYFTYIFDQMLSKEGQKLSNGSALKNIPPFADMKKQVVNLPSLPEQQKIADFLSNVDEVIAASEEEVANLEQQKKAVMQKIFSQEVRFKKEDGSDFPDWENNTLVSMCDSISDGDWIESKDQSESGVRLIQTGNVGVGTFITKEGKEKWISEETFARLRCKEVKPGTILVSRLPSPAGRACIVPDIGSKMITAVDCSIVCVNDDYCDEYIVQYLCSSNYFKDVEAFLAGGTRQRISRGNLETIMVPIPTDKDEQQLIADFLTSYDEAITAAKQELAKWKELKKGLLQQMFV